MEGEATPPQKTNTKPPIQSGLVLVASTKCILDHIESEHKIVVSGSASLFSHQGPVCKSPGAKKVRHCLTQLCLWPESMTSIMHFLANTSQQRKE